MIKVNLAFGTVSSQIFWLSCWLIYYHVQDVPVSCLSRYNVYITYFLTKTLSPVLRKERIQIRRFELHTWAVQWSTAETSLRSLMVNEGAQSRNGRQERRRQVPLRAAFHVRNEVEPRSRGRQHEALSRRKELFESLPNAVVISLVFTRSFYNKRRTDAIKQEAGQFFQPQW